jgi:crossover junction endodeoxyribonuclease RuvC
VIALGVDPGTRLLGWGVVRLEANRLHHIAHGVVRAGESRPLAERLRYIDEALGGIIEEHRPDVGSVETLFFHKDAQAAAKLGHARGVVLLALARANLAVAEYAPAQVKQTIAGKGHADKRQVALMVRAILGLSEVPPADAADALAIALTHLRKAPLEAALAERLADRSGDPRIAKLLRGTYRPGRRRRVAAGA